MCEETTAIGEGIVVDKCIASLVKDMRGGGIETLECCCGHGKGYGTIDLADGTRLLVENDSVIACEIRDLPEAVSIEQEGRHFVVRGLETGTSSFGAGALDALENFLDANALYREVKEELDKPWAAHT